MLEQTLDLARNGREEYWKDRILAQLRFAVLLSQEAGGAHDELIRRAERVLLDACPDGVITPEAVRAAEEALAPLGKAAKEYEIICAAHAHIDMNWQWGWDETVGVVLDTVRTMLNIFEEYPQFVFSQSQASVYQIIADYDPDMLEEVKRRVQEGRWEVTASTWVEADKNMPSGESLARQHILAKKYLTKLLGLSDGDICVDFEPDTFGHSMQVPEILKQAGIPYYYHCRGRKNGPQLYRWRGPSGAEVLVNREMDFYSTNVDETMAYHAFEISRRNGFKTTLRAYGVGDHGGGPTRRDMERLLDMDSWPVFPAFRLGTYREFFRIAEQYRGSLPVLEGESGFIFDGCYSAQSRNKEGNHRSEDLLFSAEAFSALAALEAGKPYPQGDYENAWEKVLLNQFHDIITGSGVAATRDYALGLYQQVYATAGSKQKQALRAIADRVDTSGLIPAGNREGDVLACSRALGAGAGSGQIERGLGKNRVFHVFNSAPMSRKEAVELMLWEWYGDTARLEIRDAAGEKVRWQLLDKGYHQYWGHHYLKLLVETELPACGYQTYTLREGPADRVPLDFWPEKRAQEPERFVLENEFLRAELSALDGSLLSVVDLETGKELLPAGEPCGVFRLITEGNHKEISGWGSEMSSWLTGRYKEIEVLNRSPEYSASRGPVRDSAAYRLCFHDSALEATVSLDKGERFLRFAVKCDWHERGSQERGVPRLEFYVPLNFSCPAYRFDAPFGVAERKPVSLDLPAVSFAAASPADGSRTVALWNETKYGYRCENTADGRGSIALPLLRSSFEPDPDPENGDYEIRFALGFLPGRPENGELLRISQAYHEKPVTVSDTAHRGELPLKNSFLQVEGPAAVSCVKAPDSGEKGLFLRLSECEGTGGTVRIAFSRKPRWAVKTDLYERETVSLPDACGENSVCVELVPYEVAGLKITF